MVAATLVPLAGADPTRYLQLSMALAILVGVVCIFAGLCRAGFIANFLSRPILNGFLSGMGLTIIAGQFGKILGFKMEAPDFISRLAETAAKLGQIHWPTAIFSVALLMLFLALKRTLPVVPVPLVGIALGISAVLAFNLGGPWRAAPWAYAWRWSALRPADQTRVGRLENPRAELCPRGRPYLLQRHGRRPQLRREERLHDKRQSRLCRSRSRKHLFGSHTRILHQWRDSRTAINDSVKGRTQIVGIVSALATAAVLVFFTAPLANVPNCALGAVLIFAGAGLIDIPGYAPPDDIAMCLEFGTSIVATLGVILLGVLPGLAIAIALGPFILLHFSSHPRQAILGLVPRG